MKYKVHIVFTSGDIIDANVEAKSQGDAINKLEYALTHGGYIEDLELPEDAEIGSLIVEPCESDLHAEYDLKQSQDEGWWVATDVTHQVVVVFKEGDFNGSKKITPLNDMEPIDIASSIRGIGDWLCEAHPELL